MASNALANVAAAVTAGYKEVVTDRGVLTQVAGNQQPPLPRFVVLLEGQVVGQPGNAGSRVEFQGEGATQVAAETVALANLNAWRANRYGSDSGGANSGTLSVAPATPSTAGQPVVLVSLTKDKH